MKWLLVIAGVLIGLGGVAALAGWMLPLRHHSSRKARYRASPEAVYAVLAGPPDWRTGVKSFGQLPDEGGRKRWWEQDTHGQKIIFELLEDAPPRRMATRIADRSLPFGGVWTFDVSPAAGGSELRVTEDGEIYNVIFRFLARFFFGYTASIDLYLRDLAAKFGEAVAIEE